MKGDSGKVDYLFFVLMVEDSVYVLNVDGMVKLGYIYWVGFFDCLVKGLMFEILGVGE